MLRKVLALVALLLVAAVLWVGVRGFLAYRHAQDAAAGLRDVRTAVLDGDLAAARAHLDGVQQHTGAAVDLTSDPVWDAFAAFPWGGQNLEAVSVALATSDDVAQDGMPAMLDAAAAIDQFTDQLSQGELDTSLLQDGVDGVQSLQGTLQEAQQDILAVDREFLAPRLGDLLGELVESMDVAEQLRESLAGDLGVPSP